GTSGTTSWDGGVFGLLSWASIMLAGTLVYDAMSGEATPTGKPAIKVLGWGVVLMAVAYGLSCLSMLYDDETATGRDRVAASPVWPPLDRFSGRRAALLLSGPPFALPRRPERGRSTSLFNKECVV